MDAYVSWPFGIISTFIKHGISSPDSQYAIFNKTTKHL